jgi:MFS family permease
MLELERNGRLILVSKILTGAAEGLWYFILPLYIAQLGATPRQIGFVYSLGNFAAIVGFLIGGYLADRINRKGLLLVSRTICVTGMIVLASAKIWWHIIPGLALYYFAWLTRPVITSYLAHIYRERNPVRAFTAIYSGFSMGVVTTPAIGGWIAANTSKRNIFIVSAFFFFLAALPYVFLAPQRVTDHPSRRKHPENNRKREISFLMV